MAGYDKVLVEILNSKLAHDILNAYELGAKDKEEQIIKLLEDMAKSTFAGDVWHINPFDYAIALIKEENK